jgi:hypothetical protein
MKGELLIKLNFLGLIVLAFGWLQPSSDGFPERLLAQRF